MSSPIDPRRASPSALAAEALLAEVRAAVDARLEHHLRAAIARAADAAGAEHVVGSLAGLVRRGGKRFRPALLVAAHRACGGVASGPLGMAVLDVGAAWEILQAYFLIHDDWMDGDATRRGGKAVHVELTERHGDAHLGASAAVLAGDYGSALAQRVVAELEAPAEVVREAVVAFARVHEEVVLGQAIDLTLAADDADAVRRMHALKTGSYTVRGPVELGAILARAGGPARDALRRFADPIGVAFQLRDDLLGTFGDPAETGKPVGSDLRARKRTALVTEALALAGSAERMQLLAVLSRTPSNDDVLWAMGLFERSGARAAVEAKLHALLDQGVTALDDASLDRDGTLALRGLAGMLTQRRA